MKRDNLFYLSISNIKLCFQICCNKMLAHSQLHLQSNLFLDFRKIERIIRTHYCVVNNLPCSIMKFLKSPLMSILIECDIRITNFLINDLPNFPICYIQSWSNCFHTALAFIVQSCNLHKSLSLFIPLMFFFKSQMQNSSWTNRCLSYFLFFQILPTLSLMLLTNSWSSYREILMHL